MEWSNSRDTDTFCESFFCRKTWNIKLVFATGLWLDFFDVEKKQTLGNVSSNITTSLVTLYMKKTTTEGQQWKQRKCKRKRSFQKYSTTCFNLSLQNYLQVVHYSWVSIQFRDWKWSDATVKNVSKFRNMWWNLLVEKKSIYSCTRYKWGTSLLTFS